MQPAFEVRCLTRSAVNSRLSTLTAQSHASHPPLAALTTLRQLILCLNGSTRLCVATFRSTARSFCLTPLLVLPLAHSLTLSAMALLGKRKADKADVGHSSADAAPAAKKQQHQRQTNRQGGRPYNSQGGGKGPAVLGRADRAALRKERRASKPHSDIIENANQLYRFDFKRMEAIERRVKIAELMERCAGKVADVLTKHDTSRVFQLMVKYGSGEQRQQLSAACKGSMVALCVNHYAHHFILKLLQYGSPLVRQAVWRELQGHVAQLAFHADGAVVFDYLYASEKSKKLQMDMTRELLHPTFALEAQTNALTAPDNSSARSGGGGGGGSLAELCESQPTIAASMVEQVRGLLEKWLNKNQLQYRFVHAIARQYLELPATVLPRLTRADFISALCSSPSLSALCASNDGVLTLCAAVSDGAAKDRKQVMRCLRSDALTVCRSLYGHLLLMRVVDCVDDTVAVAKNVWSSLLSDPHAVAQLINDVHGAKVVRFMLHGKPSSQFLSPFEAKFQSAPQQPSQPSQPSQDTVSSHAQLTLRHTHTRTASIFISALACHASDTIKGWADPPPSTLHSSATTHRDRPMIRH